jgi:hypothetical protein
LTSEARSRRRADAKVIKAHPFATTLISEGLV